jgi:Flp pilus assembly protein TadD
MDAVVAREFKNELPTIITKTLIASAIKAGATYGAYAGVTKGGKKNTGAGLAVLIAGAIYQVAMNQADLRTWTTLPKEFHFCRIPTPADRKIELEPPYSGRKTPVVIDGGGVNVVWAKSVNRNSPLLVTQFKLKDEVKTIASPETATAVQNIPQIDVPKPDQATQQPESLTPGTETQREVSEPPAQSIQKNEAIAPASENQPETSIPSQQALGDKAKSSVNTEIPLDTALRLERERILAMGDVKARQIGMLLIEGLEYMNKRDWNSAISIYKKELEIDPENFEATANIGSVYLSVREFDLSFKYLTKAIQLMPSHPIPYANFMYFYAMQGDKEHAMEFLQKAVDRGYRNIDHIKNDTDLPEDFKNDPRFKEITKHLE